MNNLKFYEITFDFDKRIIKFLSPYMYLSDNLIFIVVAESSNVALKLTTDKVRSWILNHKCDIPDKYWIDDAEQSCPYMSNLFIAKYDHTNIDQLINPELFDDMRTKACFFIEPVNFSSNHDGIDINGYRYCIDSPAMDIHPEIRLRLALCKYKLKEVYCFVIQNINHDVTNDTILSKDRDQISDLVRETAIRDMRIWHIDLPIQMTFINVNQKLDKRVDGTETVYLDTDQLKSVINDNLSYATDLSDSEFLFAFDYMSLTHDDVISSIAAIREVINLYPSITHYHALGLTLNAGTGKYIISKNEPVGLKDSNDGKGEIKMLNIYTIKMMIDPKLYYEFRINMFESLKATNQYTFLVLAKDRDSAIELVYTYIWYSHRSYASYFKNNKMVPMNDNIKNHLKEYISSVELTIIDDCAEMVQIIKTMCSSNDQHIHYRMVFPGYYGYKYDGELGLNEYIYNYLYDAPSKRHNPRINFILDTIQWTTKITNITYMIVTNASESRARIMNDYVINKLIGYIQRKYALWFNSIKTKTMTLQTTETTETLSLNGIKTEFNTIDVLSIYDRIQKIYDKIHEYELVFVICDKDTLPMYVLESINDYIYNMQINDDAKRIVYMEMLIKSNRNERGLEFDTLDMYGEPNDCIYIK